MAPTNKRPNPSNRPNRPSGSGKSASSAAKSASPAAKQTAGRTTSSSAGRPPTRKPGKSIVNQKQTPWGLIATAVVLVLFAGGIVAYAVTRHKDSSTSASAWAQPELAAAKKIVGVKYKAEPDHTHTTGLVKYNTSPPTGGNHSPIWALCDGVVYDHQIANENAVHMLEHGAIWITYNPKISASDLAILKNDVDGVSFMALSPYAGLKTPISLQAWGYQLFLQKASDKRIDQFVAALKNPSSNTPEPNAGCTGSGFIAKDSTLGHPYNG